MWFVQWEVILTKDKLAKINWHGCKKNMFFMRRRQFNIFLFPAVLLL